MIDINDINPGSLIRVTATHPGDGSSVTIEGVYSGYDHRYVRGERVGFLELASLPGNRQYEVLEAADPEWYSAKVISARVAELGDDAPRQIYIPSPDTAGLWVYPDVASRQATALTDVQILVRSDAVI